VSVRFLADADLNQSIVDGVLHREPAVDFETATDAGLEGVLVSHDTSTMPMHFAARFRLGLKNPGVLLAFQSASVGQIVESLLIVWSASSESEWQTMFTTYRR
jgi:hypothetical protein